MCDGVVGGQGNGPLNPEPLPLGLISFTNTSGWNDLILAEIMGMNSDRIPLLVSAKSFEKNVEIEFKLNNNDVEYNAFKKLAIKAEMPPGWVTYDKH